MFKRVHFERACMEMHIPILDGFQVYVEHDQLKIYRKKDESTGTWEFKVSLKYLRHSGWVPAPFLGEAN